MRLSARWALQSSVLALSVISGIAVGIFALHSVVWAAALAAACALASAVFLRAATVRNTAICLTTVFVGLLIFEGVVRYQADPDAPAELLPHFEPQPLFVADPAIGWALRASSTIHATRRRGEHIIYQATYTIGPDGFRVTPASRDDGDVVLFFGDSFLFGDGLPDSQTLPQLFAARTGGRFGVINLGVSAYGAHQVLRQLETGVVDRALRGRKVQAAFLYFIDDHLARATGDKFREWWWLTAPQYEVTPRGPRLVGTAAEDWARRSWVERTLSDAVRASTLAKIIKRFTRLPVQLELSEALVRQIRLTLRERYGVELVVIYHSGDPRRFFPTLISGMVERAGAPLVFIPDLLDAAGLSIHDRMIQGDGHPTGRFNGIVADALARRLEP